MSTDAPTPPPLRPSVFISYASEDRAAARALRDTLLAAGLEVWYDENELGGGDAWDQKIRRQIRDCDYFMPLISANTERRKEGYFRREWRLACERTLDMADDVLFLLPVAIDGTLEGGARVPEKFLTVQWLRLPGGQTAPTLEALIAKLLVGDHTLAPRPPLVTRPPIPASMTVPPMAVPPMVGPVPPPADHDHAPPPMPPFPHAPETNRVGHWLKYVAEIIWWAVTATWLLVMRLPKWVRIVLSIWLVITLISTCDRPSSSKQPPKTRPGREAPTPPMPPDEVDRAVKAASESIGIAIEKGVIGKDWEKVGEEIAKKFAKTGNARTVAGKQLVLAPFAPHRQDPAGSQLAQTVFAACYGKILLARPADAAMSPRLPPLPTDEALAAVGRELRVETMLGFRLGKNAEGVSTLSVRLIRSEDGTVAWSGDYPTTNADAAALADLITQGVLAAVPAKP